MLARRAEEKKCYLYRLFAAGSIEEKVFQRQLSKESLQNVVNGEGTLEQSAMSKEELRRLFALDAGTRSDTHDDGLGCEKCPGKCFEGHVPGSADAEVWEEQDEEADENKLETWGHHHKMDNLPDPVMRRAAGTTSASSSASRWRGAPSSPRTTTTKRTPRTRKRKRRTGSRTSFRTPGRSGRAVFAGDERCSPGGAPRGSPRRAARAAGVEPDDDDEKRRNRRRLGAARERTPAGDGRGAEPKSPSS